MTVPLQRPWAILLCRFSDDQNDPAQTRISDLYRQWGNANGAFWLSQNLTQAAEVDNRTILELYQTFFTITGLFTFNVVRFFDEMSHGQIDVSGSQVFPCTLDLTAAQGAALAQAPGGSAYETEMFKRAKQALAQQHGVDWKVFFGVAVSFQSPDYGSNGGTNYDGGPGVFADIRYVRNDGTRRWGHEMGHAFGLSHSRTDGEFTSACSGGDPADYTDWWDIMSINCAFSASDPSYGFSGPGLNAWNMRSLHWLDESRIWKATPNTDFSERVRLLPLHQRNHPVTQGVLGAELPGVGADSAYLVEFRVPEAWDAAFGKPVVIVHRYQAPNSFIMKGTNGQKVLGVGDIFEIGSGPFSRLKVELIDTTHSFADVLLCHSAVARRTPTVKIVAASESETFGLKPAKKDRCHPTRIAGSPYWFTLTVTGGCLANYRVQWSVTGAAVPFPLSALTSSQFMAYLPAAGEEVTASVTVIFDDGITISDTISFRSISQEEANWIAFLCTLNEREVPIPWWRWEPMRIDPLIQTYSRDDLKIILTRAEGIVQTLRRSIDARK
jgi:hypothetical protein